MPQQSNASEKAVQAAVEDDVYAPDDFDDAWFARWRRRAVSPFYLRCEDCGRGRWSWTTTASCVGSPAVGTGCLGVMRHAEREERRTMIHALAGSKFGGGS